MSDINHKLSPKIGQKVKSSCIFRNKKKEKNRKIIGQRWNSIYLTAFLTLPRTLGHLNSIKVYRDHKIFVVSRISTMFLSVGTYAALFRVKKWIWMFTKRQNKAQRINKDILIEIRRTTNAPSNCCIKPKVVTIIVNVDDLLIQFYAKAFFLNH